MWRIVHGAIAITMPWNQLGYMGYMVKNTIGDTFREGIVVNYGDSADFSPC